MTSDHWPRRSFGIRQLFGRLSALTFVAVSSACGAFASKTVTHNELALRVVSHPAGFSWGPSCAHSKSPPFAKVAGRPGEIVAPNEALEIEE